MSSLEQAIALSEAGRNDEAVMMIRQVASTGDPHALFLLAQMTWGGGMVAQDPQRGRLLFEHAGACGHPDGGIVTTNLLGNGVAGARNWPLAIERLRA